MYHKCFILTRSRAPEVCVHLDIPLLIDIEVISHFLLWKLTVCIVGLALQLWLPAEHASGFPCPHVSPTHPWGAGAISGSGAQTGHGEEPRRAGCVSKDASEFHSPGETCS